MRTRGHVQIRVCLDLALLSFLPGFRKVYIGEHVMHASRVLHLCACFWRHGWRASAGAERLRCTQS